MGYWYWTHALEPVSHNYWACTQQQEEPTQGETCAEQRENSPRSPQLGKACRLQQRPSAAINKQLQF